MIAAANPLKGTYTPTLSFNDNVDLTDPILSRFDLLAVVRDEVDPEYDDALATFVINSHIKSHPNIRREHKKIMASEELDDEEKEGKLKQLDEYVKQDCMEDKIAQQMSDGNKDKMDQDLLKKYLIYARRFIKPKL